MTILLTSPFCWPFVRRGVERLLHELPRFLVQRGHHLTIVSTGPKAEERFEADGVSFIRKAQPLQPLLSWVGIGPEIVFPLQCLPPMLDRRRDLIVCLSFHEAVAARLAGWITGRPYVLHLAGIPTARYFRRRPLENLMFRFALGAAVDVVVISRAALEALAQDFGRAGALLPPPCDIERFSPRGVKDLTRPRIVASASFAERRKGARVLLQAFALLKDEVPGAVLEYTGAMPDAVRRELLGSVPASLHRDIVISGVGDVEALADVYSRAAVVVLPSIGETFGMVLVEALACGTPVVGSRDGGIVEIISPEVGRLFDPVPAGGEATNAAGLARAIKETLAMHDDPALAARCRTHAAQYSWERLGPRWEALFVAAAGRGDSQGATGSNRQHASQPK